MRRRRLQLDTIKPFNGYWELRNNKRQCYVIDRTTILIFWLLVARTIKRHPAPFNKTEAGRRRRCERRQKQRDTRAFVFGNC